MYAARRPPSAMSEPDVGDETSMKAGAFRSHLSELVVVFVGVALAFVVENLRQERNDRIVGEQYLSGFRQDLKADLEMLEVALADRAAQRSKTLALLEFFEGRPIDPQRFFEVYWSGLRERWTAPHRNTMDEVLSSGSLRLLRDREIRTGLLRLYVTYDRIADLEGHMARDFDAYLYDPTFSSVRIRVEGPWKDTPENRQAVGTLLGDLRIENGLRLIVANLDTSGDGLLSELELARSQVERLLQRILPE